MKMIIVALKELDLDQRLRVLLDPSPPKLKILMIVLHPIPLALALLKVITQMIGHTQEKQMILMIGRIQEKQMIRMIGHTLMKLVTLLGH